MTRLGVKMGASPLTFAGLAGMGDLVLTCTGALSRNRSLGVEIARGVSLDEANAEYTTLARRFAARFFVGELPSGQKPKFDATETVDQVWVTPADALTRKR